MKAFILLLILFSISAPHSSFAETAPDKALQTPQTLYQKGVFHYQNSEWEQAQELFKKALLASPNNPLLLYNIGLSSYHLQKTGEAIACLRKALFLSTPLTNSASLSKQALTTIFNEAGKNNFEEELNWNHRFRRGLIHNTNSTFLGLTLAILLFLTGFFWLKFLGKRKIALNNDSILPKTPYLATLLLVKLIFVTFLFILYFYELSIPRGTVLTEKASVHSSPNDNSAEIFQLREGNEVLFLQKNNGWIQVSQINGLTGWIKKDQIFQTTGKMFDNK